MQTTDTGWEQFVSELADEANQLASELVGLSEDEIAEILRELHAGVVSTLIQHLGQKRSSVVARAFTRLVSRRHGELQSEGWHNYGSARQ